MLLFEKANSCGAKCITLIKQEQNKWNFPVVSCFYVSQMGTTAVICAHQISIHQIGPTHIIRNMEDTQGSGFRLLLAS